MEEGQGIIRKKIRRKQLVKIIASIMLAPLCLFFLYRLYSDRLLTTEGYLEPYDLENSLARCDDISDSASREMIQVSLTAQYDDIVDTGVSAKLYYLYKDIFLAAYVEGKYIVCPVEQGASYQINEGRTYTFTGVFKPMDGRVKTAVLDVMKQNGFSYRQAEEALYGFIIDTEVDAVFNRTVVYIFFTLLVIASAFLLIKSILPFLLLSSYPGFKNLPDMKSFVKAIAEMEKQYSESGPERFQKPKPGLGLCIARNWLFVETRWSIKVYLADDFLWAYQSTKVKKETGLRAERGKRFVFVQAKYATVKIAGSQKRLDELMAALGEAYPWMRMGITYALSNEWMNDVGKFIAYSNRIKEKSGFRGVGL